MDIRTSLWLVVGGIEAERGRSVEGGFVDALEGPRARIGMIVDDT